MGNRMSLGQSLSSYTAGLFLTSLCSLVVASFANAQCAPNEIGGVVFRDYNANGSRDLGEPGAGGISVAAVNGTGNQVAVTQTADDGSYRLTLGTIEDIRISFSNLPAGSYSGPVGITSRSTVAFARPGSCSVSLGLTNPLESCGAESVVTSRLVNGDPLQNGSAAALGALVSFPYSAEAATAAPAELATAQQVGSIWGLAYQRSTQRLFAAASLKRHAGLGSLGLSGIYSVDLSTESQPVVTPYARLSDFGYNFGTDPRQPGDLFAAAATPSQDPAVWDLIGKAGFGDIEMSEDDQVLYAVNLADRRLYLINVGASTTPLTAAKITTQDIPNPGCSNGNFVPWALKAHQGKLYVGTVCTAEISKNPADLRAIVLEFNGTTFTSIAEFSFGNFSRGYGLTPQSPLFPYVFPDNGGISRPWLSNYQELVGQQIPEPGAFYLWAQLILSAIEFDSDGSMFLGFKDRTGDQFGPFNFGPVFPPLNLEHTVAQGDLVKLCKVGQIYLLENNAGCPGSTPTAGMNNGQGPGGGEFFYEERSRDPGTANDTHQESIIGATVMIPGTGEVVATVLNPFDLYETAGVHVYDTATGEKRRAYQIFGAEVGSFGKSAGLGDMEVLCEPAPLQIGNRVWRDLDKDGVQDATEPGIAGVTLTLVDSSTKEVLATQVTAADGSYLFNQVPPNRSFFIRVGSPANFASGGPLFGLALTDALKTTRTLDSDGSFVGTEITATLQTGAIGANDHSYDFGFITPDCTVTAQNAINVQLDGASRLLNMVMLKAVREIKSQSARKTCVSNQSARTLSRLVAEQERLHQSVWQRAWGIDTSRVICDRVVPSCVTTSVSSVVAPLQAEVATMRTQVEKVLANRCFKRSSRAQRSAKQLRRKADQAVALTGAGVAALGTSLTSCPLL